MWRYFAQLVFSHETTRTRVFIHLFPNPLSYLLWPLVRQRSHGFLYSSLVDVSGTFSYFDGAISKPVLNNSDKV